MTRRSMALARAKVDAEARCRAARLGGCDGPLEAAHVVERRYDGDQVPPAAVVPLCTFHHARYDARRISLLEFLDHDEQAEAVAKLGIVRALKRLTSGQTTTVERPPG